MKTRHSGVNFTSFLSKKIGIFSEHPSSFSLLAAQKKFFSSAQFITSDKTKENTISPAIVLLQEKELAFSDMSMAHNSIRRLLAVINGNSKVHYDYITDAIFLDEPEKGNPITTKLLDMGGIPTTEHVGIAKRIGNDKLAYMLEIRMNIIEREKISHMTYPRGGSRSI